MGTRIFIAVLGLGCALAAQTAIGAGSIVAVRTPQGIVYTNLVAAPAAAAAHSARRHPAEPSRRRIRRLLHQAARRYALDPRLVLEVARQESDFDPRSVSDKGAMGVMQLMPATARALGVRDPFNAAENIAGGARYLRALLREYRGNVRLSLAAYNAGPGAVAQYGGAIPPYRETRSYVRVITRRLRRDGDPIPPHPTPWRGSRSR
ncbi:MAG: lytic transglycosylase domain-containing protein [Terriglobales bacterium]